MKQIIGYIVLGIALFIVGLATLFQLPFQKDPYKLWVNKILKNLKEVDRSLDEILMSMPKGENEGVDLYYGAFDLEKQEFIEKWSASYEKITEDYDDWVFHCETGETPTIAVLKLEKWIKENLK